MIVQMPKAKVLQGKIHPFKLPPNTLDRLTKFTIEAIQDGELHFFFKLAQRFCQEDSLIKDSISALTGFAKREAESAIACMLFIVTDPWKAKGQVERASVSISPNNRRSGTGTAVRIVKQRWDMGAQGNRMDCEGSQ